ncbi:MAG: hypothetical protein B1H07_00360 [Campylobacteraceae bacterium 4484_166]|nr:MAG: hypothetical protein B1H07_00360 [Campylobacteraceae bacterium 4484_166]
MHRFLFVFFLITIAFIFSNKKVVVTKLEGLNYIVLKFYDEKISLLNQIKQRHTDQANTIKIFQENDYKYEKNLISYASLESKYNNIKAFVNTDKPDTNNIKIAKVLSLKNLYKYSRYWLSYEKDDDSIDGLITNNFAAGIVKYQDGRPLALLNHDEKANYGVFVGPNKALGITQGMGYNDNIVVKFIPVWSKINIGDEVITNGLDDIFFEGLKVGVVTKILDNNINHLEVEVKTYAPTLVQKYYYVY